MAPFVLAPFPAVARGAGELYGVIEVGASGLKVSAYTFAREKVIDDDARGPSGRERWAPQQQGKSFQINTNIISDDPAVVQETADVIKKALERLTARDGEYKVPAANVAVVASSGVAIFPDKLEAITALVKKQTGVLIDSVSAQEESKLSYDWIVLSHRRQQVLLIDIGSGNTKGGYYEAVGTPQQRFRDFAVPYGTKSFGNAIRKAWPTDPVGLHARDAFTRNVVPALNTQIESAPGLINRPRIYFAGGIIWATAMLVRPAAMAQRGPWVRLTAADFATLARLIQSGDPYSLGRSAVVTPAQRVWLDKQLTSVAEVFNPDQLTAGNALCLGLADRLDFASRSAMFFASFSVNAWSSQYLANKFYGDVAVAG